MFEKLKFRLTKKRFSQTVDRLADENNGLCYDNIINKRRLMKDAIHESEAMLRNAKAAKASERAIQEIKELSSNLRELYQDSYNIVEVLVVRETKRQFIFMAHKADLDAPGIINTISTSILSVYDTAAKSLNNPQALEAICCAGEYPTSHLRQLCNEYTAGNMKSEDVIETLASTRQTAEQCLQNLRPNLSHILQSAQVFSNTDETLKKAYSEAIADSTTPTGEILSIPLFLNFSDMLFFLYLSKRGGNPEKPSTAEKNELINLRMQSYDEIRAFFPGFCKECFSTELAYTNWKKRVRNILSLKDTNWLIKPEHSLLANEMPEVYQSAGASR